MKGQLSSEAKGAVDGILDQFDGLDEKTKKKFANAVYGALEGLEGFDELKDPAKEGVDEFLESLRSAWMNIRRLRRQKRSHAAMDGCGKRC